MSKETAAYGAASQPAEVATLRAALDALDTLRGWAEKGQNSEGMYDEWENTLSDRVANFIATQSDELVVAWDRIAALEATIQRYQLAVDVVQRIWFALASLPEVRIRVEPYIQQLEQLLQEGAGEL